MEPDYHDMCLDQQRQRKWDHRFLRFAREVASWSHDPSTKVGAVIVRPDLTIASCGYNGFPRGCDDDPKLYLDRDQKLRRVVHAELNAILSARETVKGYTLYQYSYPKKLFNCDRCATALIQAGISRIVLIEPDIDSSNTIWYESFKASVQLYKEAKIIIEQYKTIENI